MRGDAFPSRRRSLQHQLVLVEDIDPGPFKQRHPARGNGSIFVAGWIRSNPDSNERDLRGIIPCRPVDRGKKLSSRRHLPGWAAAFNKDHLSLNAPGERGGTL